MDRETKRQFEEFRRSEAGPIENNLIDELVGGDLDRQEFLRRATMFGLGAGTIGMLLRYLGEDAAFGALSAPGQVKRGGTLRVGVTAFTSSLEPYLLREAGSLALAGIPGEYLTFSNNALQVRPWLATSWKANASLTRWTFQLRRGVKFHNGKTMTADDVVASFRQYVSQEKSEIYSAIPKTLLGPEGVVKTGPYTVQFRLKQPSNAFPSLVSQTTYMAIIQPAAIAARPGTWVESGMIGTGAFRLKSYTPNRRAELVRFPGYWGGNPPLDGAILTFYEGTAPQVLALRAGQLDLCMQLSPQEARSFRSSRFRIFSAPTSAHRMFGLRTDREPFTDARVRRALALTLNRPDLIQRLLLGSGTLGNDSPFWSKFPSTSPAIKQRAQNLQQARALLQAAGEQNPKFTITTWRFADLPDYAAAVQAAGRQVGFDIDLEVMTGDDYYGGGADYANTTPWLNRPATITEYGAAGVPNRFLTAVYMSDGIWNAAKYKKPAFDAAAKQYLGSIELRAQRAATKRMSDILLADTPVITAFFITYITAGSSRVRNYQAEGISHIRIAKTWLA